MNAGKYNKLIQIVEITESVDADGFPAKTEVVILEPYAEVKTTKGFTLIANNSDFEKALTNFTIRYSSRVENSYLNNNRNLRVKYKNKEYTIEYLNNVNEADTELEIQAKVVKK